MVLIILPFSFRGLINFLKITIIPIPPIIKRVSMVVRNAVNTVPPNR
jgi:hypothetical protein